MQFPSLCGSSLNDYFLNSLKNIFKELAFVFDSNLQTISESPASLSDGLLFKWVNAAFILAFSSSLVLYGILLVTCSTTPHAIMIKGIAIYRVRLPDVRDDVVAEIFLSPTLDSSTCVTWHRIQ